MFFFSSKGNGGNSLGYHNKQQFSTKDNDNDARSGHCAVSEGGAWWYKNCDYANLNAMYVGKCENKQTVMRWYHFRTCALKKAEMKIRPSNF